MIFNPWKHVRLAACVVFFIQMYMHNMSLLAFGVILLMTGIVGGIDLAERRIELLEKLLLEDSNAKAKTPENN